jgi:peroxiredoxin Q/BCP
VPRLQPGDHAPAFSLTTADGEQVSLSDLTTGGRRAVVYFYPTAGTPGCTTQACDFRDSLDALHAAGFSVLGVSPDDPAALRRFAASHGLTFPLASDPDKTVLEAWGAWGEKSSYGRTLMGVIRSTVVVAPDGTVEHAAYNVRAKGHVAKLRRDLGVDG